MFADETSVQHKGRARHGARSDRLGKGSRDVAADCDVVFSVGRRGGAEGRLGTHLGSPQLRQQVGNNQGPAYRRNEGGEKGPIPPIRLQVAAYPLTQAAASAAAVQPRRLEEHLFAAAVERPVAQVIDVGPTFGHYRFPHRATQPR